MKPQPSLGHAAKVALEYRVRNGLALDAPCDIYELIVRQGVDLHFMDVKSLEGFYLSDGTSGQINVCAYRPAGLQRFTAAHELGHHVFGHGSSFDPELDYKDRFLSIALEERLADLFARFLMMPRPAVYKGFKNIGASLSQLSARDVYRVAAWLGVGYTTLLHQMRWSLQLLDEAQFESLIAVKPQTIKQELTPCVEKYGRRELWAADKSWDGSRIHAEVGDIVTGLSETSAGIVASLEEGVFETSAIGHAQFSLSAGGKITLSVSRKEFVGFYEYRYLPEPQDA
jgi:Zn-dependent peptidase ImmA (M78 family)